MTGALSPLPPNTAPDKPGARRMFEYRGRRDPRLVREHRGGLLDETRHRLLAAWAADCAEHVLPLFAAQCPDDDQPLRAVQIARAWARGEATAGEAREAAVAAHAAARSVSDPVARDVARATGHAAATAHMADHGLSAATHAIRAVRKAASPCEAEAAGGHERRWQRRQSPAAIRELILSDR